MAKLTRQERKALPKSDFIFPAGTHQNPGKPMLPVPDAAHGRAALGRAGQAKVGLTAAEKAKVVKVVHKDFPTIGESKEYAMEKKPHVAAKPAEHRGERHTHVHLPKGGSGEYHIHAPAGEKAHHIHVHHDAKKK